MLRHLRAACAALAIAVSGLAAPASAAAAATPQAFLAACHTLTARTATNPLVNGEFELPAFPDFVGIDQTVWLSGSRGRSNDLTGTWFRDDPTGLHQSNTDATRLAFSCKGDLALRTSRNVLLWHTGTANRGATRLSLTSDGNLVMTTASGHVVWQSRSGRQLMPCSQHRAQQRTPHQRLGRPAGLSHRDAHHASGREPRVPRGADRQVAVPHPRGWVTSGPRPCLPTCAFHSAGTVVWRSRTLAGRATARCCCRICGRSCAGHLPLVEGPSQLLTANVGSGARTTACPDCRSRARRRIPRSDDLG